MAGLIARIKELEGILAVDPNDERVRRRQFRTDEGWVWSLEVEYGLERWMLVWGFHPEGDPEVRLLMPAREGF